ncbi:MAG TPA: beta-phosphoglucomutase [Polyangiaceae bacterium]|jgi:beta-phosphoglucomutase|nr:beta-phosphoglucomutase [Polyangiaceae bacterium]
MLDSMQAALFDLDGVIVDTAKFHYLAWRELANGLGFDLSEAENEKLKGVSRMESLDIILKLGGVTLEAEEKLRLATIKNGRYVEMIRTIDASEILRGAREYLLALRARGVKVALGSASKNAEIILQNLGVRDLFDAVIDGNKISKSKPDPEVFLLGAQALGIAPSACVVYEDAAAGVEAAKAGGMYAVGIGQAENLPGADLVVPGLYALLEN